MSESLLPARIARCWRTRISNSRSKSWPRRSTRNAACARTRPSIARWPRSTGTPARRSSRIGCCSSCERRGGPVNAYRPIVAITVGDPAGIGPEIAQKAAEDRRVRAACEPRIYAPPPGGLFAPGVLSADAGRAAYETICAAVRDALDGRVAAVATAPVNKLAFARAGLPWKGHTDLLAHLTHAPRAAMMFWSEPLKVVLATVHVPLAEVPRLLTRELLHDIVDLTAHELPRFGIAH